MHYYQYKNRFKKHDITLPCGPQEVGHDRILKFQTLVEKKRISQAKLVVTARKLADPTIPNKSFFLQSGEMRRAIRATIGRYMNHT